MKTRFNHAANDSPRSGGTKTTAPIIWGVVVIALAAAAMWTLLHS